MNKTGLSDGEWNLIKRVFASHPEITGAILYGSRAKGNAAPSSDVDLALEGIDNPLRAEAISGELDELPLPYRFDVRAISAIQSPSLREHIASKGIRVYG